jgi:phenylalanyl-tRNA synthetase beta chain
MKVHALAASPVLDRDLSLVVDDSCTWARLAEAIRAASLPHLEQLDFVGTWRGKGIAIGRKSVTMRLLFRCEDRTLRREEIDPEISKLVKALGASLGAELRA